MKYLEIEQLVHDGEFQAIVSQLIPTFEKIEEYSIALIEGRINDAETASSLMMKCTGYWDQLNVIYTSIETYKTNVEKRYFHEQKIEIEKTGGKFNASATEGEASAKTVELRRVRNLVKAYMDSADKNIISCQSQLKYLMESMRRTAYQEG